MKQAAIPDNIQNNKEAFKNFIKHLKQVDISGGFKGGGVMGTDPPYFLKSLAFCNHLEELKTVLFEVELIINNAPLTYVYPNTIETCLTSNHLLLYYLLFICYYIMLLYSSNTTSTIATNLIVPSGTTDKINRISNHFWDRWRHEYVVNLREIQRTSKFNIKR